MQQAFDKFRLQLHHKCENFIRLGFHHKLCIHKCDSEEFMLKYVPIMVKALMFIKKLKDVFKVKIHGFDSWVDLSDKCMSNHRKEEQFSEFV